MSAIFLSASVPLPERDPRYIETADVIAIRDAVRALAAVVLPSLDLHWGGHPSITPLIRSVCEDMGLVGTKRVHLYQSLWFEDRFVDDNDSFHAVVLTERRPTLDASLAEMRRVMLTAVDFEAGIFIGGMEGVEDEFRLFRQHNPFALALPVATTGAAAAVLYQRHRGELPLPSQLAEEYTYASLFRDLVPSIGRAELL